MNEMTESTYRIHGATGDWEVVIGLEVHAQVTSKAKLFSGASTEFGAEPNTQVSLVDAAMPGMLPVPNRECIRQAVRTGMAISARISSFTDSTGSETVLSRGSGTSRIGRMAITEIYGARAFKSTA